MSLSKQALDTLSQPVVNIYNAMEQEMLVNMAEKLKGKMDLLEKDPEAWKLQQMNYLGMLDRENLNTIRKNAGLTASLLNKILYNAMIDGMDQTDGAMEKAIKDGAKLRVPKPISQNPQILSILKAYQDQAGNILNLTNQTMVKSAKKIYVDVLNRSVADVVAGVKTPDQAIRRTIGMWADQGIPALIDKAGKKWGPEGYVRTVVNTTAHNTVHKMQDTRFDQWGVELVEVSSHAGARPLCAPYQGRIYKIQGSTPKYPNLYTDTSYGAPAGLFGINCGHHKYPFIEGINTQTYFPHDPDENDKIYQESQKQRALERSIRNAKTRVEMCKAMGDDDGVKEATQLVKDRQAKLREFIDTTGRTRRRDREQIVTKKIQAESTPDVATKLQAQKDKEIAKQAQSKQGVPDNIPQTPTPQSEYNVNDHVAFKFKGKEVQGQIIEKDDVFFKVMANGKEHNIHESAIMNKVTPSAIPQTNQKPLLKSFEDLKPGDTVQFMTKSGKEKQGEILVKHPDNASIKSGEMVYKVQKENIITHLPDAEKPVEYKAGDNVKVKIGNNEYEGEITGKHPDVPGVFNIKVPDLGGAEMPLPEQMITGKVEPKPVATPKPKSTKQSKMPLTLEDFKRLDSKYAPDIARDTDLLSKMDKKDVYYIHKYTTNYYTSMNAYLRDNRGANNSTLVKEVENLQRVLKDNAEPLTENTRLFRVVGSHSIKYIFNQEIEDLMYKAAREGNESEAALSVKDKLIGGTMEDKAFVSSTWKEGSFGSSSDLNIHIYAPKGYRGGMFVQSVSAYGDTENEYLFNSGMTFDIQDIDFTGHKMALKVIPRMPDASQ